MRPESRAYYNSERRNEINFLSPIKTEIDTFLSRSSNRDYLNDSLNLRASPIPRPRIHVNLAQTPLKPLHDFR